MKYSRMESNQRHFRYERNVLPLNYEREMVGNGIRTHDGWHHKPILYHLAIPNAADKLLTDKRENWHTIQNIEL